MEKLLDLKSCFQILNHFSSHMIDLTLVKNSIWKTEVIPAQLSMAVKR